ncbi:hypothetical protein M569_13663, partial [Genlisea aurea]
LKVTHLQFADDTIPFKEWTPANLSFLNFLFYEFGMISGLYLNPLKSSLVGVSVADSEVRRWASHLGWCNSTKLPLPYLGMSLDIRHPTKQAWKGILENIEHELRDWRADNISYRGRHTHVNAVLSSLPTYQMSLFRAPKGTLQEMERIKRRFFWAG